MKIGIVSDMGPPYVGGAETYVLNTGKKLVERGHEVHWTYMRIPNTKRYENIEGINCHRVYVPFGRKYLISRKLFCVTMLPEVLKMAKKVDILQFNTFVAGITGWTAGKLSGKPYVLLAYELFQDLWKSFSSNIIEQILFPSVEKFIVKSPYPFFITISNYTKNTLTKMGVDKQNIKVIYPGVDHDIFHLGYKPVARKKFRLDSKLLIGWAGRMGLSYSKNLGCLIKAFEIVKKEMANSVLMFDGPDFQNLIPTINGSSLKIGKDVIYNGCSKRTELSGFYSSLDLYVSSSLSEGFGLSVAEAEACGKPIVCFDAGALPEVVKNKKTGLVIKEKTEETLAEAIIELLTDKKKRERYGKAAARWSKFFDWEKTVKEHVVIYERLTEKF